MEVFSVNTRKGGREILVESKSYSYFIGECTPKSITTGITMRHAMVICNALNKFHTEDE